MLHRLFRTLPGQESGQSLVEYSLILALVGLAALVGIGVLGGGVHGMYEVARSAADAMAAVLDD